MWKTVVLCVVRVALNAQDGPDALRSLEASARKYQDIESYESSAIALRPLESGVTVQIHLKFGYAGRKMTPADVPVPMLPQIIQMEKFELRDAQGKPGQLDRAITGPGPAFAFDQMAWRVTKAEITGKEAVTSHLCDVVEVQYEGTRRNANGEPVRYWIDPVTSLVWKMQFSEPDGFSKTGELARWTVTWDSWIENSPPPAWLIDAGKSMLRPKQQTELIGQTAPEVTGVTLAGEPFQLSKSKGKVLVLDFSATWCGPCSEEMASLERLKASLGRKELEIWSITEDNIDAVKRWIEERKRTLPVVVAAPGSAFKSYRIDDLPQVVIVNRNGIVSQHWIGLTSEKELRRTIEASLAQ